MICWWFLIFFRDFDDFFIIFFMILFIFYNFNEFSMFFASISWFRVHFRLLSHLFCSKGSGGRGAMPDPDGRCRAPRWQVPASLGSPSGASSAHSVPIGASWEPVRIRIIFFLDFSWIRASVLDAFTMLFASLFAYRNLYGFLIHFRWISVTPGRVKKRF